MEFKIRNYRGISSADIELSRLTLICGQNTAGKTSLIDAIRSVATSQFNPFKEITKKEISMLVRAGTPSGFAEIIDGENSCRIDWPECKYSTKGTEINVSQVATGIRSLVDMDSTTRINYIVEMMSAAPTDSDLIRELKAAEIFKSDVTIGTTELFKRLWTEISENGWDNAYKQARDKGVKLKTKWELITGQKKYGVRIAEQWTPEAWDPELEKTTEVDLIAAVNKAKEWTEAAIKDTAISDFEIERLTSLSANIAGIKKKQELIRTKQSVVEGEMNKKKTRLRTLRSAEEICGLICPECKTKLTLSNNELKKIPEAEYKKASKDKAEAAQLEKDIKCLQVQNNELIDEFGQEKSALKVAEDAALKLKNIEMKQSEDGDAKVEEVKNKLALAENKLKAFRDFKDARKAANDIILNKRLCDILAPSGLRNKKLTKAIATINNSMKALTDFAGWDRVELMEDCSIMAAGVPYGRLIAKSERYRTRALLQLMVAMVEKAPFVIIDDADELTKDVRNQLMNVIYRSGIQAIVVSALNDRADMPDLSKINGRAYWIEEGRIK